VAFDGSSDSHVLYRLASEAQHLRTNGRSYSCLVVRKPGCGSRVSIENLCFDDGGGGPEVYSTGGECITREVEFATYGQMLVNNSRCITDDDLIRMIRNGEFYDLRHVFLFGRIETGPDRRIDIGLAGLWDEQGNIDADAVERALRGDRTFTDVRQFAPGRVRQAMLAKGYAEVADPKAPGEYSLKSGILMVVLKRGIYPHNMIGVRDDGRLIVAAVRGLSNRVGVTLPGGAEIMRMLGAKAALLIDNGGDVMMSFDDEMVLCSCEEQRDRLRSMILFRTMLPSCQLQWSALRLIKYPKHYANDQATSE
jgi:hypothetical protein